MNAHGQKAVILKQCMLLAAALLLVPAGAGVARAQGGSPWWHLSSFSRPAVLRAGQARDEVQEVHLSSEEGFYTLARPGHAPGSYALLSAADGAGEVQRQLEREVYGAGNVKVNEAPRPPAGRAFRITTVGELEDQRLRLLEAATVKGTTVSVSEVTQGRPDGVIVVNATNLGDGVLDPTEQQVTVTDVLPGGMKALAVEGIASESALSGYGPTAHKLACSRTSLSCIFTGKPPTESVFPAPQENPDHYPIGLAPYEPLQVRIAVKLAGVKGEEVNRARVSGGGVPAASVRRALTVGAAETPFGVSTYEMSPEELGGGADTQAGSHPFQFTTTLTLNQTVEAKPVAPLKDLHFKLPPGLIGNPEPFPRCSLTQFFTEIVGTSANACAAQTVVGVARVLVDIEGANSTEELSGSATATLPYVEPVYNLEPEAGEPARFGFLVITPVESVPVLLDTAVRTGGDYGVTVNVRNITESAAFLGSEVTLWGVPGDASHNNSRGVACLVNTIFATEQAPPQGECPGSEEHNPPPLLSMPTSCTGPLVTSMEADSWSEPGVFGTFGSTEALPAMGACNRLPFSPSVRVTPDGSAASEPTGLNVDVHVPQDLVLNPRGLAESAVRNITVALPEGVAINPAGGDGLEACSEGLVGFEGFREYATDPGVSSAAFSPVLPGSPGSGKALQPGLNFCADASKIGTVTIHTPLLPNPLTGAAYLGAQEANPFGSLIAMYVVVQDPVSGTLVKLPGVVHLTPSGQIVLTFAENPQLPFEDAELHFFGGERAPLTSPARCGSYTTNATYTPWSGGEEATSSSAFEITSGPHGSPCPGSSLPFSPSLTGGTTSIQAGGFSPFTMTMSREDGQQPLQGITLHMPKGLSGLLQGVELCGEAQANTGTCGPNSQIGETTVGVGVGGDPFTVTGGKVFITGPYRGAPFGLSIVNPAKAGPFDLEHTAANHPACDCLVVRAKLEVDPHTAAITVATDNEGPYKIPTMLEGIPLEIKHVNVTVGRPGFIFNPTSCEKMQISGSIDSAEGASQTLGVPFQATNCATLGFKPKFAVSTSGKTSRLNGASLNVKLTYPKAPFGSQANIARVKVELPKGLPSRLTTLQKACTSEQFHANPSGCPQASIVGHARAITPLVPVPLEGPAYFVSNGNESFPNLILVLQGYGVTIDLVGDTFISKTGITSSTFKTVPDAPVGSFELNLPQGPYSALAANGSLCKKKLSMPTEFVAQNGAQIKTTTKIQVTGCPKTKKTTHRKKRRPRKHAGKTRGKSG